jgi:hypothetical protein
VQGAYAMPLTYRPTSVRASTRTISSPVEYSERSRMSMISSAG